VLLVDLVPKFMHLGSSDVASTIVVTETGNISQDTSINLRVNSNGQGTFYWTYTIMVDSGNGSTLELTPNDNL